MQRNVKVILIGRNDSKIEFIINLHKELYGGIEEQVSNNIDVYKNSLGVGFTQIEYKNLTFQFWATHNQQRFHSLNAAYFTGVQAIIYINSSQEQKKMAESNLSQQNNVIFIEVISKKEENPDNLSSYKVLPYLDQIKQQLTVPILQLNPPKQITLKKEKKEKKPEGPSLIESVIYLFRAKKPEKEPGTELLSIVQLPRNGH